MKVPFKVSARTARLIGRENVSNAEGAIIELIKNSYDADGKISIIYFDNKYIDIPENLTDEEYSELAISEEGKDLLTEAYIKSSKGHTLNPFKINNIRDKNNLIENSDLYSRLRNFFKSKNCLYIIDNGDGMTEEIIQNCWMTIGTDNKENNYESTEGRIKSGAKGIGRFALDRLGDKCEMHTFSKVTGEAYNWNVNWKLFESAGATLDNVFAELNLIKNKSIHEEINKLFSKFDLNNEKFINIKMNKWENGSILKVSDLRDQWTVDEISNLYSRLEVLIPPEEQLRFSVLLMSSANIDRFGIIKSALCNDFDYKVVTKPDKQDSNMLNITIYRNEFDLDRINKDLFNYKLTTWPYDSETFSKCSHTIQMNKNTLVPGYAESVEENLIHEIGEFEFTFYFLKRTYTSKKRDKYFVKEFLGSTRVNWLDKFGGIKLYRDNFRVRPYGDIGTGYFDWLNLDERVRRNPAAVSDESRDWRVSSKQIAGFINISRINNKLLEDKSSREGLIENNVLDLFRQFIVKIIGIFEEDRKTIFSAISQLADEKNKNKVSTEKALSIADKIINKSTRKDIIEESNKNTGIKEDGKKDLYENLQNEMTLPNDDIIQNEDKETEMLAHAIVQIDKENKELQNEVQTMRTLASTGLIITSFTHEFEDLRPNILKRVDKLKEILAQLIDPISIQQLKPYNNPFILLEQIYRQEERLKYWLDFSLYSIKKDKRTKKRVNLYKVFEEFKDIWQDMLDSHHINLKIPSSSIEQKIELRLFPIDIDSIFNNLIANSIYAFLNRKDSLDVRDININFDVQDGNLIIFYEDSGPGLSKDIEDPNKIFEELFTTRRNKAGVAIGTGLGMWIVKNTIRDYKGKIEIVKPRPGFKLKITLPLAKDEGYIR